MNDTILLVDDEKGIRKVLGISLADSGYTVHTADSGQDALRVFRAVNPPIVLTDIKMPDMDGIELLRKIKQEKPETEVIMFTGQGDMNLAIQSLKHDATDFVTKPIDDEILEIAIKRAQERISLRRKIREYNRKLEERVQQKAKQLIETERLAAVGQTIADLSLSIERISGGLEQGLDILGKGIESDRKQSVQDGWAMIKGNVDKIKNTAVKAKEPRTTSGSLLVITIAGRMNKRHMMPPTEPIAQPLPETRPISSGVAISVKSAL